MSQTLAYSSMPAIRARVTKVTGACRGALGRFAAALGRPRPAEEAVDRLHPRMARDIGFNEDRVEPAPLLGFGATMWRP